MTAALLNSPATGGMRSLELRWIFPGQLDTAVAGWFGRFPAETESREDVYLLSPGLRGLSVKLRAGRALDVKVYRSSSGILDVADRVRGRLESWHKWSFPFSPLSRETGNPPGWTAVAKRRRICRFALGSGQIVAGAGGRADRPECAVELTEIRTGDQVWWSLGFEATGPASLLHNALEASAMLVFTQPLPGGVELGTDDSRSYAEWLRPAPARKYPVNVKS